MLSAEESTATTRLVKVSSPEKENELSTSETTTETPQATVDDSGENEKVSNFGESVVQQQQQRKEETNEEVEHISSMNLDIGTKRAAGRKQYWKSQSIGDPIQQVSSYGNTIQANNSTPQEDETHEQTTFSANRELWQRRATSQTQLNPPIPPAQKSFRTSQEFREMRQKHTPDLVMDLPLSAQDASKKSASTSSLSSSDEETPIQPSRTEAATSPSGGPESPDMSTAAERFAKQNQCTLKKNTKTNLETTKIKRNETDHELEHETEDTAGSCGSNHISDNMPLRSPLMPRSTPKIVAKFADMHLTGGSQVTSFKPQVKVKPTILRKPMLPFSHPHVSPELSRKIEKQIQNVEETN